MSDFNQYTDQLIKEQEDKQRKLRNHSYWYGFVSGGGFVLFVFYAIQTVQEFMR